MLVVSVVTAVWSLNIRGRTIAHIIVILIQRLRRDCRSISFIRVHSTLLSLPLFKVLLNVPFARYRRRRHDYIRVKSAMLLQSNISHLRMPFVNWNYNIIIVLWLIFSWNTSGIFWRPNILLWGWNLAKSGHLNRIWLIVSRLNRNSNILVVSVRLASYFRAHRSFRASWSRSFILDGYLW